MTLPEPIDRIIKRVLSWWVVVRVQLLLSTFYDNDGGLMAAGLAYQALLAFLTGILLLIGLIGFVIQDPAVKEQLLEQVVTLIPPLEPIARQALTGLAASAGAFSIIGLIGLAWSTAGFYGAIDRAFARIFGIRSKRSMVSRTIRGLVMVGLLVVLVGGAYVLSLVQQRVLAALPAGPEGDGARLLTNIIVPLLALAAVPVFVAFLYHVVPNLLVPWRALLPPAILVGIAVGLLTQLFVFIAPLLVGVLAVFGAFAVVFAALAWLSLVFQALLIGAAWTRIRIELLSGGAGFTSSADEVATTMAATAAPPLVDGPAGSAERAGGPRATDQAERAADSTSGDSSSQGAPGS